MGRHPLEARRHLQTVPWTYLAAEPRPVYAAEQDHPTHEAIIGENGKCSGLGQSFDDENPREDGVAGEVTRKERLFSREMPTSHGPLASLYLQDLVHEEKRCTMRQHVFGIEHGCRR
jgi:hypothetical protein